MKLLFPTDFSQQANNAFEVALKIAKQHKAELHILHSVETNFGWNRPLLLAPSRAESSAFKQETLYPELHRKLASAKTGLSKLENQVSREGLVCKTHLGFDYGHKDINSLAEHLGVEAVIMGTFGRSGKRKIFIGSNTIQVVRNSEVPVLTINRAFDAKLLNNVLLVSEFEAVSKDLKLKKLVAFLKKLGCHFHLGFINTPYRFEISLKSEQKLLEAAQLLGIEPASFHIYNHEFVEDGILALAYKLGNPTIALTTRGIGGVQKLLTFSVAEYIIKEAPCPVLTIS